MFGSILLLFDITRKKLYRKTRKNTMTAITNNEIIYEITIKEKNNGFRSMYGYV